jgi:DNA repair photolyase
MNAIITANCTGPVVKHPGLPCMRKHYTVNLTNGCPHECHYCSACTFRMLHVCSGILLR